MKAVCLLCLAVATAAAAPAFPNDQPVQLVVMTTKALKALGVDLGMKEEIQLVGGHPFLRSDRSHHKIRHPHRRYKGVKCQHGRRKDIYGKCRRVWGF